MSEASPPKDSAEQRAAGYAEWSQRALSSVIDMAIVIGGLVLVLLISLVLGLISHRLGDLVRLVGLLAVIAVTTQNQIVIQGNSGQSIGKKQIGIKLISQQTGQPLGPLMTSVRQIAHLLDWICLIGYLWPLRDEKKQTFADKIVKSIVIRT
jgi:uncharacterized RDD family membrane protein YckC